LAQIISLMKLRSLIILLSFCVLPVATVQAQIKTSFFQDIEVFGGIGSSHYFGDIGGKQTSWHEKNKLLAVFDNLDIDWEQTRVMLTAGARFTRWRNFALSVQLSPVFLSGHDYNSDYQYRDLVFNTTVIELSTQGEYYFANRLTGVAPYGLFGVGVFYSFGSGNFDLDENNIPFKTIPYRPFHSPGVLAIVGLGLRLPAMDKMTHSFDLSYHFTSTDNLDGLKTKHNINDLFVTFSYKINVESFSLWTYDHKGLVK